MCRNVPYSTVPGYGTATLLYGCVFHVNNSKQRTFHRILETDQYKDFFLIIALTCLLYFLF